MTGNHHAPWAEQDGDGMWEPSCRDCGLLTGPPFYAVLQRYNTEEEAFAAANAVLSMMPANCCTLQPDLGFTVPTSFHEQDVTPKRETLLMDSQRAWLRRVKHEATVMLMGAALLVIVALILIDQVLDWTPVSILLFAFICLVPLIALSVRLAASNRLREVDRQ